MSFVVVNMGGSGSMFLAEALNRSKKYTVTHEGMRHMSINVINNRLSNKYYGDINGHLRMIYDSIKCDKKAIIIRNPRDIFASWYSHWRGNIPQYWWNQVVETYDFFDKLIERGEPVIRFDYMIGSIDYLYMIANYLDISDIDLTDIDLTKKVNNHNMGLKYEDISTKQKNKYEKHVKYFCEKYEYLWK